VPRAALPDSLTVPDEPLRRGDLLLPIRPNEDDHSGHECDSAVNGPLDLPGHKASRQHIDSLEEPYAAEKDQDRAHDIQYDSHVPP